MTTNLVATSGEGPRMYCGDFIGQVIKLEWKRNEMKAHNTNTDTTQEYGNIFGENKLPTLNSPTM